MEELYNYLDKIKYELDNSSVIKEYLKSKDKVMNNKELVELIDKCIKSEIINNKDFREYKKHENDVNFLILEINKILKDITKKGGHGSCQG